jgi:hypothetical protein
MSHWLPLGKKYAGEYLHIILNSTYLQTPPTGSRKYLQFRPLLQGVELVCFAIAHEESDYQKSHKTAHPRAGQKPY